MFFKTKIFDLSENKIFFSNTELKSSGRQYNNYIDTTFTKIKQYSKNGTKQCKTIDFVLGFTPSVIKKIKSYTEYKKNKEAFAIKLGVKTVIWAMTEEGFIFALSTLLQLAENNNLCEGFIYDYPINDIRGYRTFLPPKDKFDDFYNMVDFLAYYKYNSLIIEVGGAMEYERHPEINEAWLKICNDVNSYSGRGNELQHSKTYPKNCFHCQNGGGDYLSQDQVRELVAYCRSRGIEVIPECPTLSHCDYLVTAHPEIAERNVENYPDLYPETYCPNHPDTYKYVFDILEEVIEVFQPKSINIGHDELYSVGICPRCKNTPAPKLYAQDVWTIRNFLNEKNVHVFMWGEKLLRAQTETGYPIGGTGKRGRVPRLYPCRDLLPKDITILHWYLVFNPDYDKVFLDRGYDTVYGNLSAMNFQQWNYRRERGIHGGFVSNWGSFEEEYMQRNMQYFSLTVTAYAFWCEDFESLSMKTRFDMVMRELYRLKNLKIKNAIKVTHTTSHNIPFKIFYDGVFIEDEEYILGNYELTYTDGTVAYLPVKYGTNITTNKIEDYANNPLFKEVSYSTLPKKYNDNFVYECVYENPHPDKNVLSFKYIPSEKMKEVEVELFSVNFQTNITDFSEENISTKGPGTLGFIIYD